MRDFCMHNDCGKRDCRDEMVISGDVIGDRAPAADLEKGEVWEEASEDGETYEIPRGGGDSEKRVRRGTADPNLTEPLLTPEEVQHQGLAAASTPLVATEKIIVSLLVVCFVLVEAYFVGRSFRNWMDNKEHKLHDEDGTYMNKLEFPTMPLPLETPFLVPVSTAADASGGGLKESFSTDEPLEVALEGSVQSGDVTVAESMADASPIMETSTRMTRLPPAVEVNTQLLGLQTMDEDAPISADSHDNYANGGR
ncbi:unnamed protein product [Calypogeia fissa]